MNLKKIFTKLQTHNISEAECRYVSSTSLSLEVFHGEISNFKTNTLGKLNVDAIIDHKLVMANSEDLSNHGIDELIDSLILTAPYVDKQDGEIFKGASKYKKFNNFNKELPNISIDIKKQLILNIEKKIKEYDSRFTEVQVGYEELCDYAEYQNTYGVKLKNKSNSYSISAYVVAKENNQTTDYFLTYINNIFNEFNIDKFVEEVSTHTLRKLQPTTLTNGKYNVILDPEVTTILLDCYISQLSAELVLKNSTWFNNKINTLVASPRVTIFESPLKRDMNFEGADAQCVPTINQTLIKKGVLLTYLHNLETARKFKVEPTGHAVCEGTKIGIKPHESLYLKPGRLTKDELIKKANNGIYITSLEGLHAGMNAQSGNFSLKAEGFIIKDGHLDKPVEMITVTSNLFEIFQQIKGISKNIEYIKKGLFAPCIYLKKISISC